MEGEEQLGEGGGSPGELGVRCMETVSGSMPWGSSTSSGLTATGTEGTDAGPEGPVPAQGGWGGGKRIGFPCWGDGRSHVP